MSENNQYSILWKQIREALQTSLSPITYNTYISKLVPVDVEDTKIVLRTDTEFFANFIGKNLTEKMKEAFKKADTGITDFELVVDGSDDVFFSSIDDEADEDFAAASVDPRFTFSSFVAGKSNEFVFAAAKAVAKSPGSSFNPCTYTARPASARRTSCRRSPTTSPCTSPRCASCTPPARSSSTS